MDVLLIGIAALALILAIGMGLILFKVLNDERQRSDARVAALAAAAATVDLPLASQTDDLALPDPVISRSDLFVTADEGSPWPRRAAVAAVLAVVVAIGGYAIAHLGRATAACSRPGGAARAAVVEAHSGGQHPDRQRLGSQSARAARRRLRCSPPRFSSVRTAIS